MMKFFIAVFLAFLTSCNTDEVFHEYQSIPYYWDKNETVRFTLPEMDSLSYYNLYINVRNNNDYKYSNLFLIVSMNFPNGKVIADTLEYPMAHPDGHWMGNGFGSIKESKLWYKENVRFPEAGNYTVHISHAMRNIGSIEGVSLLEGITDVGFSAEKTDGRQ